MPKRWVFDIDVYMPDSVLMRTQVECYQRAVVLDKYLAIAYFQQGVSNFLVGDFEEALANFNDTLGYLRGNSFINYEQLGLKFKLFSCEVLFNRGLCYIYLQQTQVGMEDLTYAAKEKGTPDHDVIDEAIKERAEVSTTALTESISGLTVLGLYRLLNPRRGRLPSEQCQSEKLEDQRLPRESPLDRCFRPRKHFHRICWLRSKEKSNTRRHES